MQRGERECFMRIAVFSDSHGVKEPMLAAIEEQKPDMVLHLGDYVRDAEVKMAQLLWRLPLGVCGAAFLYFSGRAPERLDRVFGNRAVRFLSAISYNFYIWHQFLAVKLKEFHIPAYVSEFPQMSEGRAWQTKYTLLCFAAAFLLSAALTYLVEKPAGRALLRLWARKEKV